MEKNKNIGIDTCKNTYKKLKRKEGLDFKKFIKIESNKYDIETIKPMVSLIKKANFFEGIVGDIVTFKIIVENKGNIQLENIILRDLLSPELKFINDTVKIDKIKVPNANILSGITIENLKLKEKKEIIYEAEILSRPIEGEIITVSLAHYKYRVGDEKKLREYSTTSNENLLKVHVANIEINKEYNKKEIILGDAVTCLIELENNGTLDLESIVLKEFIDSSLKLVENKFMIEDRTINNIDISKGVFVGNLKVGERKKISYIVKYDEQNNYVSAINTTKVNFNYKLKSGLVLTGGEITRDVQLKTNISNFKYISIEKRIYRGPNKPYIDYVNDMNVDVDIVNYHIIKTIKGESNEGQISTGNKLLVQGMLKEIIEYTTEDLNVGIYSILINIPFSVFIVLPSNFKEGSKIKVDYQIEDVSFSKVDNNSVYTNVCLLLAAQIQKYI